MKAITLFVLFVGCIVLGGCFNNYNGSYERKPGCPASEEVTTPAMTSGECSMMSPGPTVVSTTYQEVYTTEYTPSGPVVRKAIIPVYSSSTTVNEQIMIPAAVCTTKTIQQVMQPGVVTQTLVSSQPCIPVVPGFPPAQPVQPSIVEPAAFFGPTSAPCYTTQTSWF